MTIRGFCSFSATFKNLHQLRKLKYEKKKKKNSRAHLRSFFSFRMVLSVLENITINPYKKRDSESHFRTFRIWCTI